jgi:hypothetical protein
VSGQGAGGKALGWQQLGRGMSCPCSPGVLPVASACQQPSHSSSSSAPCPRSAA